MLASHYHPPFILKHSGFLRFHLWISWTTVSCFFTKIAALQSLCFHDWVNIRNWPLFFQPNSSSPIFGCQSVIYWSLYGKRYRRNYTMHPQIWHQPQNFLQTTPCMFIIFPKTLLSFLCQPSYNQVSTHVISGKLRCGLSFFDFTFFLCRYQTINGWNQLAKKHSTAGVYTYVLNL